MRAALSRIALVVALSGCSRHHPDQDDLFNRQGALPSDSPVDVLEWKVISSSVDRQQGTMATLTGNDVAVKSARAAVPSPYPTGSVLALATWAEREDPHWFGARIPGRPQSIETVTVMQGAGGAPLAKYKKYAGEPIKELLDVDASTAATRKAYILAQRASVMP